MKKTPAIAAFAVILFASCKKEEDTPTVDPKTTCVNNYDYECTYNVYHNKSLDTSLTCTLKQELTPNSSKMNVSILRSKDNRYTIDVNCETQTFTMEGQPGTGKIYPDSLVLESGDYRRVFIPRRS